LIKKNKIKIIISKKINAKIITIGRGAVLPIFIFDLLIVSKNMPINTLPKIPIKNSIGIIPYCVESVAPCIKKGNMGAPINMKTNKEKNELNIR
jgi:hypothetical protein